MSYTLPKALKKKIKQEELYQITSVFKNFDRDKDGTISMSDVHMCLHSLGERTKAKKEKQLFKDHQVDGKIPFQAFCEILADFRAASPRASAKPGLTHGCVYSAPDKPPTARVKAVLRHLLRRLLTASPTLCVVFAGVFRRL